MWQGLLPLSLQSRNEAHDMANITISRPHVVIKPRNNIANSHCGSCKCEQACGTGRATMKGFRSERRPAKDGASFTAENVTGQCLT